MASTGSIVIAVAFLVFEATISLTRKPLPGVQGKDRRTFELIWIGITLAILVGIGAGIAVPVAGLPRMEWLFPAGVGVFVLGMALRVWSIRTLGRFFTVQVAIAGDHRLIEAGPYRRLRHPSYTGSLLMFAGCFVCFGNALTLAIVLAVVIAVFARRIQVEEAALAETFGQEWIDYVRRSWRLFPGIY